MYCVDALRRCADVFCELVHCCFFRVSGYPFQRSKGAKEQSAAGGGRQRSKEQTAAGGARLRSKEQTAAGGGRQRSKEQTAAGSAGKGAGPSARRAKEQPAAACVLNQRSNQRNVRRNNHATTFKEAGCCYNAKF